MTESKTIRIARPDIIRMNPGEFSQFISLPENYVRNRSHLLYHDWDCEHSVDPVTGDHIFVFTSREVKNEIHS